MWTHSSFFNQGPLESNKPIHCKTCQAKDDPRVECSISRVIWHNRGLKGGPILSLGVEGGICRNSAWTPAHDTSCRNLIIVVSADNLPWNLAHAFTIPVVSESIRPQLRWKRNQWLAFANPYLAIFRKDPWQNVANSITESKSTKFTVRPNCPNNAHYFVLVCAWRNDIQMFQRKHDRSARIAPSIRIKYRLLRSDAGYVDAKIRLAPDQLPTPFKFPGTISTEIARLPYVN